MTEDSESFATRREYRAASVRPASADPSPPPSRAGRDLRAAIGVGVGLGAVILATLLLYKPLFVAVATVGIVLGVYELIQALRAGHIEAPPVPTLAAAVTLMPLAYVGGTEALAVGFACFSLVILVWCAAQRPDRAIRDAAGGIFITAYVPLMSGLAALMVSEPDGVARIVVFILVTISSDIGGYAVGVVFGRHPMAPSLSPKKSWEGFAGSVASCVLAGLLSVVLLLDGDWWVGAVMGAAVACFATMGDLAESTLKRDLGIKDMGSMLPGHGGLMDRLDSLVMTIPVSFAILTALVAP
jgi:phosphatidate cytidylyltransferase